MTPEPARRNQAVLDELATDYIHRVESGESPPLAGYLDRVQPTQRDEFRSLVDTATWLRSVFPNRMQPTTVLGGRYELVHELGSGGFGKVWVALDRELQRRVAVKIMSLVAHSTVEGEVVHETERAALARIAHPGTVTIQQAGRDGDLFWLAMDLVDGASVDDVVGAARGLDRPPTLDDLRAAIGAEPMPGEAPLLQANDGWSRGVARIVGAVLRTLEAVHAAEVIHRDIKPSNVMLRGGGHPVLVDFGMASLRDEQRGYLTERLVGTASYLAPEQVAHHRVGADPRTDVYQVGLVLYEMLTLRPAFPTEGATTVIDRIRVGEFATPRRVDATIPAALEAICLHALECSPDRRYQTADAFGEDLRRFLDGDTAPIAVRGGLPSRALRTVRYGLRRHRLVAWAVAALLVGVLMGVLWLGGRGAVVDVAGVPVLLEDGIRAVLDAEQDARVFGLLRMRGRGGDDATYVLPLLAGAGAGASASLAAGSHELEFRFPPDAAPQRDALGAVDLAVLHVTGDEGAAAMQTAWSRLLEYVADEGPFELGIAEAEAERVVGAVRLPTRGAEEPAVDVEPERIVGEAGWTDPEAGRTITPVQR